MREQSSIEVSIAGNKKGNYLRFKGIIALKKYLFPPENNYKT